MVSFSFFFLFLLFSCFIFLTPSFFHTSFSLFLDVHSSSSSSLDNCGKLLSFFLFLLFSCFVFLTILTLFYLPLFFHPFFLDFHSGFSSLGDYGKLLSFFFISCFPVSVF